MTKIIIVLIFGLICEAAGVVLLKEGIDVICKGRDVTLANIIPTVLKGAMNLKIMIGVALEAVFFACLLYLMSQREISFVWPLTSGSFVMATLAAVFYLKEHVSPVRWAGVALIMLGAGLITWSEKVKEPRMKIVVPVEQSDAQSGK